MPNLRTISLSSKNMYSIEQSICVVVWGCLVLTVVSFHASRLTTRIPSPKHQLMEHFSNAMMQQQQQQQQKSIFIKRDTQQPPLNIVTSPVLSDRNHTILLQSYICNLQKRRSHPEGKEQLLKMARSLAFYLERERPIFFEQVSLQRAVVQAIRAAASANDYKLILQLVRSAQDYYDSAFLTIQTPSTYHCDSMLDSRILGEAISALGQTTVRVGRITHLWEQGWKGASVTTREVNALLQALCTKGRLRGAISMYHIYSRTNTIDAYSISILLNALKDSIVDKNRNSTKFISPSEHDLVSLENAMLSPLLQSPCWQWNEAIRLFDSAFQSSSRPYSGLLNNAVFTAFLQLNKKATKFFKSHEGSERAIWILDFMRGLSVTPDHKTSALILSSLGREWELAISLFRTAQQQRNEHRWSMPAPNEYMYSAVMATCAFSGQYNVTLSLFQEVEACSIPTNVYIYNTVLQALASEHQSLPRLGRVAKQSTRKQAKDRLTTALELRQRMRMEGVNPDATTYNTLLSVTVMTQVLLKMVDWSELEIRFPDFFQTCSKGSIEGFVQMLLDEMKQSSIPCDTLTYQQAIRIVSRDKSSSIHRILKAAITNGNGNAATHCNTALSSRAEVGDVDGIFEILSFMMKQFKVIPPDSIVHVITALGNSNSTSSITAILDENITNDDGAQIAATRHGLDLRLIDFAPTNSTTLDAALRSCLKASDYKSARSILREVQHLGLRLTQESLHEIIIAYARMVLHDTQRKNNPLQNKARIARARDAYSILARVDAPSASLLSTLSTACCSVGMFQEAHELLGLLHRRVLDARLLRNSSISLRECPIPATTTDPNEKVLPSLHRRLLQSCAEQGNITNALRLCHDIQYLSIQLHGSNFQDERHDFLSSKEERIFSLNPVDFSTTKNAVLGSTDNFFMKSDEWTYLLTAAAKSGHWRVCLSTFQFLRPYLEATQASSATNQVEKNRLTNEYGKLEPVMTTVVKCLASSGHYAWIMRLIEDWIEWSGRRPPNLSVLAAVRLLAARGRRDEVTFLLERCAALPSSETKWDNKEYESSIYLGAVTALYKNGYYETADMAFLSAISTGWLSLNLKRDCDVLVKSKITLDLHGLNIAAAHSAVRIALQQEAISTNWDGSQAWNIDLVIVTGRGLNSVIRMKPVLRPQIQQMLLEEFYPPLSTSSVPGNMGAIQVESDAISAWLMHQQQQKGARMLIVAAIIRGMQTTISKAATSIGTKEISKRTLVETKVQTIG